MAADGEARKDIQAHQSSYAGFTFMMKWGTVVALLVGAMVVFIIGN